MHETKPPPLAGIKVVDLTRYLAGPFCTQILGDYGAEILKIEPVENPRGELGDSGDPKHHDSYFFLSTNRSKKSIRLAIKKPEGREILMRLIDGADVVVDNFRPGVMKAIGLDYETLARRNPRIITCSISGFGSTGPLRDFPGFDQIAQGMSGLMSVTGTVESGPTRVGIAICDLLGGIFSAQGILLALEARHRDGRGQRVETSLLESIVSILTWSAGIYFETGITPAPAGNNHPLSSPHGVFKASDRPFNIACGNEAMWKKFVKVIGSPRTGRRREIHKQRPPHKKSRRAHRGNKSRARVASRRTLDSILESRGNPVRPNPDHRRNVQASADRRARDAAEAAASGTRRISDDRISRQAGIDAGKNHAPAAGGRAYR